MVSDYFEKEKVDIAVIETGLGGRLDSTNIITPLVSIITNIGYDHMNLLGNSLPEIAGEKRNYQGGCTGGDRRIPARKQRMCSSRRPANLQRRSVLPRKNTMPLISVTPRFAPLRCDQHGSPGHRSFELDLNGFTR